MSSANNFSLNSSTSTMNKTGDDGFYWLSLIGSIQYIFYPIVMVIGVVGNAMVIIVVLKVNDMLNSMNIFLANLAIADIIVLLIWGLLISSNFIAEWISLSFTLDIWVLWICASDKAVNASVLTVLAIGFERYYAICRPLKAGYVCTKKRAFMICILVWLLAAISCSTPIFMLSIEDDFPPEKLGAVTNISLFFFLPPIVLTILFLIIVRRLNKDVAQDVNIALIKHRRHVITMLATVVLCFFLLQLPYRVFRFLQCWWEREFRKWLGKFRYSAVKLIGGMMLYLHSAVNPIIYSFMSKRFREGFKIICCKKCASRN